MIVLFFFFSSVVFVIAGNFVAIGFKGSPTIEIWDLDVVCKCSCLLDLYVVFINHEIMIL